MNKSISDSIRRFRPTPAALPELIKGIVNIIENDLNESRVKRFTYDGIKRTISLSYSDLLTHSLCFR